MTGQPKDFSDTVAGTPNGRSEIGAPVMFRAPDIADGARMWRLAADSGTLDVNSPYSYLLWCRDFADTSVVGCAGDPVVTFVTGYLRPGAPDTLFVWQVAVDAAHRRRGLARRALDALVDQVARQHTVAYVEATVTPDNVPSARLFAGFARGRGASLTTQSLFTEERFPGDSHAEEVLYRIGPLPTATD
ncbi:diaminobutyrate acetyltransferase [Actinocatenispora rupis]|uniref:L-2,4-diaminobutyric acid acetyltransferase n=1 Tax=Actinocatenispora rupis TaxID=519421 RepID=A0A8J3J8J9_9ACTN|nr:diaminobutyrate acetyltransferase [Actinocatenispora rupis]GID11353.1 L-2,4-diaminobutyric acid acetyltransferase [Actinocatenispora rupis]